MPEPIANQPFWTISDAIDYLVAWWKIINKTLNVGPINHSLVLEEKRVRRATKYGGKPFYSDFWYEHFDNIPIVKLPTSYHPDYFSDQGLIFVSPKLFKLLDQPKGSLQGLPTETIWFGPEYPDWEYIWLSFIPLNPLIDTDRCDREHIEERFDAARGKIAALVAFTDLLPLRKGLTSPFGTFRAAECTAIKVVSDAVAFSVLQAECTGLQFNHIETNYAVNGPLYRRGLHGVEIHPRQLENE